MLVLRIELCILSCLRPVRIRYAWITHNSMQDLRVQVYGWPNDPSPLISHWCQWSHTVQETILRRKCFACMVGGTTPSSPVKVNVILVVLTPSSPPLKKNSWIRFLMRKTRIELCVVPALTTTRIGYAGITHRFMQRLRGQVQGSYAPSPVVSQSCQWYLPVQETILEVVGETFFLPVPTPYFPIQLGWSTWSWPPSSLFFLRPVFLCVSYA